MKLSFVNKPKRKKENYEGKKRPKKRFRVNKKIEGNKATILTKKPLTPSTKEIQLNRRSRSAKVRALEKN